MNKNVYLEELLQKGYKETWDYQSGLLQSIVDTKINNRKNDTSLPTNNY